MNILSKFEKSLTHRQRRTFRSLDKPDKIQRFLDDMTYCDDGVYHCPLAVMNDGIGCCFEGSLLAAAAFRRMGLPSLIVDMTGERDDDHVLAVYRKNGLWGAVTKSIYAGLRARQPVYRTLRELVMSYFEFYFNHKGELSLRRYSLPMDLARFDYLQWMSSDENLRSIADHLDATRHFTIIPRMTASKLPRLDRWTYSAGMFRP
ncbi:MAG: hypothetical protein MUF22_10145 [Chitinispirillaceae bacterium]|nr:hypothetical protein [Chitinispirillaceae bacterium]